MNRPIRGYDYDTGSRPFIVILLIGIMIGVSVAMAVVSYKEREALKNHPFIQPAKVYECVIVEKDKK